MRQFTIRGRVINDDAPPFVIAEIGHNHGGDLETAEKMIVSAYECGCDAVKLQKRSNRTLYTKLFYSKPYDNENSYGKTYGEHREALEFSKRQYKHLQKLAEGLGLIFFATAFDFESIDFLEDINVPAYKVASGDLTTIPLLTALGKTGKPIIMSTGGGNLADINQAVRAIGHNNVAILHCTAEYPCPIEDVNLNCIPTLRARFEKNVIGLSSHYQGIQPIDLAYVFGARIFENHFTLNRASKGTDHKFSLEPHGMSTMIEDLRRLPKMLGEGYKRKLDGEKDPIYKMAKGIYAAKTIKKGEVLTPDNLCLKSPADGLSPVSWDSVMGNKAACEITEETPIIWDYVEVRHESAKKSFA